MTANSQRKKVKIVFSQEAKYIMDFANDKSRIPEETEEGFVGRGWVGNSKIRDCADS